MIFKEFLKKYLLIIGGTLSLILGIIGIFIPVLPTTPFVLLSAYCYLRSSKRLYLWLINNKRFGSYIYNYMNYRAVKKSTKIIAIVFLWISLSISFYVVQHFHIRIILLLVGIGVSFHLLLLKVLTKDQITYIENKEFNDDSIGK